MIGPSGSVATARILIALFAFLAASLVPVEAETAQAPAATVEALHGTLREIMEHATTLGYSGRRDRVAPVVAATFDLPFIARLVLGRYWTDLGESQRGDMVAIFTRLTVATYATRFDGYDGERFVTLRVQESSKGRRVVRTELQKSSGEAVNLDYVLHQIEGDWRIVNVVANGVSDLSLKRTEYVSIMDGEGFAGLLTKLNQQVDAYELDRD